MVSVESLLTPALKTRFKVTVGYPDFVSWQINLVELTWGANESRQVKGFEPKSFIIVVAPWTHGATNAT